MLELDKHQGDIFFHMRFELTDRGHSVSGGYFTLKHNELLAVEIEREPYLIEF